MQTTILHTACMYECKVNTHFLVAGQNAVLWTGITTMTGKMTWDWILGRWEDIALMNFII